MDNTIFAIENLQTFLKGVVIFLEFLYLVFAFLLVRQVRLMNKSYHTSWKLVFELIANLHFVIVLVLIVFSFFIL